MTTPLGRLADTVDALWTLLADALIAAGTAMQNGREGFSEYEAGDFLLDEAGRMESDGPDATCPVPSSDARGLGEMSDSSLLTIAATVIAYTSPAHATTHLVAALRDRAAQFAAIEVDDALSPLHGTNQPE